MNADVNLTGAIHPDITELLPAYALGALEASEAGRVAAHLEGCAGCRAELVAFEAVVDALPLAAAPVAPSPALRARLLAEVRSSPASKRAPARPHRSSWWAAPWRGPIWRPALAVLLVVLLGGAIWALVGRGAPAQTVELVGSEVAPEASGLITVRDDGRDVSLAVEGLPPLPASQQYQLWLVAGDERYSGAVFSVDQTGAATTPVNMTMPFAEYERFGVTIEPAGGSPEPTGDRVLGVR